MRERGPTWGWGLLVAVAIGLPFAPVWLNQRTLIPTDLLHQVLLPYGAATTRVEVQSHYPMDILEQDYPWALFWRDSVRRGEFPLWNPLIAGGHPHFATSMAGVLSPFKLLSLVLPAERAFSLGIVLQLVCTGVFMFGFLRASGRSPCAAFVGGCALALNSAMLMWYWRLPAVLVWVPLALWLFERSVARESTGAALAAGLVLGVAFLGGNVQSALHVGFLCAAYGVARAPHAWRRLGLMLGVAGLVAMIQWLPTLELMAHDATNRVRAAGPQPGLWQSLVGLPLLITLVFPALTGSTESFDLLKLAGATRGDFTGYIGLVPVALGVVGAVTARDRRVRWLLGAAAGVLLLLFGTPVVRYVYHRFLIVVVFVLVVIAADGVDVLLAAAPEQVARARRVWRGLLVAVGLLLAGVLAVQLIIHFNRAKLLAAGQRYVLARADRSVLGDRQDWLRERVGLFLDHYRLSNPQFWLPAVCLGVTGLAWWRYRVGAVPRRVMCGVLAVMTAGELTALTRWLVPQVDLRQYPLYPPLAVLGPAETDPESGRVMQWGPQHWGFLPNNILMVYGLTTVSGYESLAPENLHSLPRLVNGSFTPALDLAAVKYLVTDGTAPAPAERFTLVTEAEHARLYRNRNSLPRVRFVTQWRVVAARQEQLALLAGGAVDSRRVALVDEPLEWPAGPPGDTGTATVEVQRDAAQHFMARVQCAQPGLLVVADTWYPGWRARVDGRPARLHRADYVLKAVAVPAGAHTVEIVYDPPLFKLGAAVSAATVGGVLLTGLGSAVRRRKERHG